MAEGLPRRNLNAAPAVPREAPPANDNLPNGAEAARAGTPPAAEPPREVPSAKSGPEKQEPLTPAEWREKLRSTVATIVNVDDLAERAARDRAERSLTEKPEDSKGFINFIKNKIWKHGIAHEYYRQREISRARGAIKESGNIYATEDPAADAAAHEAAMQAIVGRFSHEYDLTRQGEEKRLLADTLGRQRTGHPELAAKQDINTLIKDYAAGKTDDASFLEQKKRILGAVAEANGGKAEGMYADNLLEIARNAKLALEHGVALDQLDFATGAILGKAKDAIQTEAGYNGVDRLIEKINNSRVGKYFNQSTIATGVAIAAAAGSFFSRRLVSSKFAAIASFGGTALVGAGIAGYSESKRLKEDRRQHARERAQGRVFEPGAERRQEMERYIYDMRGAPELAAGLTSALYGPGGKEHPRPMSDADVGQVVVRLAEIEARMRLMDERSVHRKIDLISYSDPTRTEQERSALDIARWEAKAALGRLTGAQGQAAARLTALVDIERRTLLQGSGGSEGIEERDRLFNKMKWGRVAGAVVKGFGIGLVAGATIGSAVQELGAAFDPQQTGIIEHFITGKTGGNTTTLESAREGIMNLFSGHGFAPSHDIGMVGGVRMAVPTGMAFSPDGHGGFSLMEGHNTVVGNLHFDSHGRFTQDSLKALGAQGIHAAHTVDVFDTHTHAQVTPDQYVANPAHPETHVSRDLWYDNDTPKPVFDKNELQLRWGGVHSVGVDANHNYTFDIQHMKPDGSSHNGLSANALELAKEGKLKLLLSLSDGTQAHPVEVAIGADGTVHIPPGSEAAKLFTTDAHGHAHFSGRFAEVAQVMSTQDATEHVRILATYEGHGMDHINDLLTQHHAVPRDILTGPSSTATPFFWDPPLPIPLFARTPLEPVMRRPRMEELVPTPAPEPAPVAVEEKAPEEEKSPRPPSGIDLRAPRIEVQGERRPVRAQGPPVRPAPERRSAPKPLDSRVSPRTQNRRTPVRPDVGEVAYRDYPEQPIGPIKKRIEKPKPKKKKPPSSSIFDIISPTFKPRKVEDKGAIPRRRGDKRPRIKEKE